MIDYVIFYYTLYCEEKKRTDGFITWIYRLIDTRSNEIIIESEFKIITDNNTTSYELSVWLVENNKISCHWSFTNKEEIVDKLIEFLFKQLKSKYLSGKIANYILY